MPRSDADRELLDLQRAMSVQGTTVAGMPSGAAAADPQTIRDWEARRAAQREAYGQFVANGNIWIGNCLAFTAGQHVPLEHVINYDLEEKEQVNRVATPAMARVGKAFESDDEFLAANPHVARQLEAVKGRSTSSTDALDPRGGGAAKDDARKSAKGGSEPEPTTSVGDDSPERRQAAADALTEARGEGDPEDDKSAKPRRRSSTPKSEE